MRYAEQVQVHLPLVAHLRARAVPGVLWFHPPMGAYYGGDQQGALMKALGARAGVSDLILLHQGTMYALELKRVRGARATAEQEQFLNDVEAAGGKAALCHGLDEALMMLEVWGLLRGTTDKQWGLFDIEVSDAAIHQKATKRVRGKIHSRTK